MTTHTHTTGTERELLETMLDQVRVDLTDTVRGLSAPDARRRLVPSLTTPITLIKHAMFAERMWFQRTLGRLADAECDGPLWAHGGFRVGVVSLRWMYIFVTAEFARHAGRGNILREQIRAAGGVPPRGLWATD